MSELSRHYVGRRYQAGIGLVSLKHGFHDFTMQKIERPEIACVKFNAFTTEDRNKIAWISFFRQTLTGLETPSGPSVGPVEIPRYARHEYYGQFTALETVIATGRDQDQTIFTPKSEIVSAGKLSPYAEQWLGLLAQENMDIFSDLYPLIK